MERPLVMFVHAFVIAVIAYVLMVQLLKQSKAMAESRSVLLGAVALAYMVVFGHKAPSMAALKRL